MTHTDVFALKNSGLEAFLFAEVGTELNGSALTLLSGLARLGEDPWAEAARLAKAPRGEAADWLVPRIRTMPLVADGLAQAPEIARRLAALLPEPAGNDGLGGGEAGNSTRSQKGLPAVMAFCVLYFLFAASLSLVAQPASPPVAPAAQSSTQGQ